MYQIPLNNDLIVDYFAGGGGASIGIEEAYGRPVDVAVNHNKYAIGMHTANHPTTRHLIQDVFAVDPYDVLKGRKCKHLHLSPDCKHFSKAKGGALVDRNIRDLAWVAHRWTCLPEHLKPAMITLENVEEFQTWGPVGDDGKPCPVGKGKTFAEFIQRFKDNGYSVDWKEQRACDYSDTPTIRKRLFLVARCDGLPIVWPEITHADPKKIKSGSKLKPWRTAAECIDWTLPAPSIFDRKRPLVPNTLKRVAKGFKRFVIEADKPYIVTCNHAGEGFRGQDIDEPFRTVCSSRDAHGVVVPYLTEHANASNPRVFPSDEPLRTQCANVKGGHFAVVSPYLVGAGGPAYSGKPTSIAKPMKSLTTENHTQVVTPYLAGVGGRAGQSRPRSADEPMATLTTKADTVLVMPYMAQHNGAKQDVNPGRPADKPLATITTTAKQIQVVAASVTKLRGHSDRDKHGQPADEPLHTISAGGTHHALQTAYMIKYYGNEREGHGIDAPLGTVTTKDRFALIQVDASAPPVLTEDQMRRAKRVVAFLQEYGVIPEFDGVQPDFFMLGDFIVFDIGMRMLTPRELARAQGFPESYIIEWADMVGEDGRVVRVPLTKTQQVNMIGNSVCPKHLAAIIRVNKTPGDLFDDIRLRRAA